MRSARVESSVTRIIFGLPAPRRETGREIEITGRALIPFDGRVESLPTFWKMRLSLCSGAVTRGEGVST